MTLRAILACIVLTLLCLAQLAVAAAFLALMQAQPGAPTLHAMLQTLTEGILPLAILTAVYAALVPGALAAMALWRLRSAGLATGLLIVPLLIPAVLLPFDTDLNGRTATLMTHASLGLALGALCGMTCLSSLEIGVLRAAAHSGVSPWGALRRVVLPVMLPGLAAATLLAITMPIVATIIRLSLNLPPLAIHKLPNVVMLAGAGLAVILAAIAAAAATLLRRP